MSEKQHYLIVIKGPGTDQTYTLNQATIIIGRENSTDITFHHPEVSRQHVRLLRTGATYTIQDLGSTNGTYVDGNLLPHNVPLLLEDGANIMLGSGVHLRYSEAIDQPTYPLQSPTFTAPKPTISNDTLTPVNHPLPTFDEPDTNELTPSADLTMGMPTLDDIFTPPPQPVASPPEPPPEHRPFLPPMPDDPVTPTWEEPTPSEDIENTIAQRTNPFAQPDSDFTLSSSTEPIEEEEPSEETFPSSKPTFTTDTKFDPFAEDTSSSYTPLPSDPVFPSTSTEVAYPYATVETPPPPTYAPPPPAAEPPPPPKRNRTVTLIVTTVLLLCCLCTAFTLFMYFIGGDWLLEQMGLLPIN